LTTRPLFFRFPFLLRFALPRGVGVSVFGHEGSLSCATERSRRLGKEKMRRKRSSVRNGEAFRANNARQSIA
jgi:hypothetical protein